MNLPEALRQQKEKFLAAVPEETVAAMSEALSDLEQTGIMNNCLNPGTTAPDFTLEDSHDNRFSLSKLLEHGSVVLKFFRGDW